MAWESFSTSELQTMLTATSAAIDKVLNAEEYRIGSRNLRRPSLDALQKREQALSQEIARRQDTTGGLGIVELGEPS